MSVRRELSGRFRAVVKSGGRYVTGKTFDTRRDAEAWERRQVAALAGGVDPRSGKQRVDALVDEWLVVRRVTVSEKTARTDVALVKWMPVSLRALFVSQVSSREVEASLAQLARDGKAASSIRRYRAMLTAFFGWCVRERLIVSSPVVEARLPRGTAAPREMLPWSRDELEARYGIWHGLHEDSAEIARFLGMTGLRWSEARALQVSDVSMLPYPAVTVKRARPEGVAVKSTKSGHVRRVPLANEVVPFVRERMAGKGAEVLLMPPMHRHRFVSWLDWDSTAGGRTVHDLRHTAICIWLSFGVDLATVRAWAGHADLTTTSRYVHWLGTDADRNALDRLNGGGHGSGTRGLGAIG